MKKAKASKSTKTPPQDVIIRTRSAGVFAGHLSGYENQTTTATLTRARRLWYWAGAASLSQLAMEGTSLPSNCKFPCEVDKITLPEVIEIIPLSAKARASIDSVKVWSA
jgi:hypothetical protein